MLSRGERDCIELTFLDGRRLVCTRDHRILTTDRRWVPAGALRVGDAVSVGIDTPLAVSWRGRPVVAQPGSWTPARSSGLCWTWQTAELRPWLLLVC